MSEAVIRLHYCTDAAEQEDASWAMGSPFESRPKQQTAQPTYTLHMEAPVLEPLKGGSPASTAAAPSCDTQQRTMHAARIINASGARAPD